MDDPWSQEVQITEIPLYSSSTSPSYDCYGASNLLNSDIEHLQLLSKVDDYTTNMWLVHLQFMIPMDLTSHTFGNGPLTT